MGTRSILLWRAPTFLRNEQQITVLQTLHICSIFSIFTLDYLAFLIVRISALGQWQQRL